MSTRRHGRCYYHQRPTPHLPYARASQQTKHTVSLTGVSRYASFTITLVQDHPCKSSVVGTLRTDGKGEGTLSFHTTAAPGTPQAFVVTSHDNHELASTPVVYSP